MKVKRENEVAQSCPTLCDPMDMQPTRLLRPWDFSRQEYWSGLPLPSPAAKQTNLEHQSYRKSLLLLHLQVSWILADAGQIGGNWLIS